MPQTSDEIRNKMKEYFGDPVDDKGPMAYLEVQGFKLSRGGIYTKPNSEHKLTEKEWECLTFMCEEWDYGYDSGVSEPVARQP